MKSNETLWVSLRIFLAVAMLGTTFQLSCIGDMVREFNPCGTIIACDPLEWDLLFVDQIPDFDLDPTCTIPGGCEGNVPFPPIGVGEGG